MAGDGSAGLSRRMGDRFRASLRASGHLPVLSRTDPRVAGDLARALSDGGLRCVEVTLRRPDALLTIEAMAAARTGVTVGAGTVLSAADVDRVADAGATFVVSPGWDEDVIRRAAQRGLDCLPGVASATDIQRVLALGLDCVKFFPANALGGPAAVQALSGPFPNLTFVPSGGITLSDAPSYVRLDTVLAVAGSWLTDDAIHASDWSELTRSVARTIAALQEGV